MLRPTFYSFETAKRALTASQMGLDTVGHNISNVNTPGYTRQRVDQVTFNLGTYRAKYASYGYNFPGQGAEVAGINQIRDPYLDRRYRTEAAKAGELGTISDGLGKLNLIFDEIQKTGSHAKIGEFLTQLDALITNADSPEQATILRAKAEDLANVLNKNSIDLENAATQQMEEMLNSVNQINLLLEQIADLNVKIKEDHFYGNPSNENNDMRNLLIDQLSELIDIDITRTPIKITEDLSVESVKITIKGSKPEAVLVDSGTYNGIKAQFTNVNKPNKDKNQYEYLDKVSYILIDGMTEMPIVPEGKTSGDITEFIFTGAMKGHLDILNGKGNAAGNGENTFRGIPYTQAALDDYAKRFADTMNNLNAVQVWDLRTNTFTTIKRDLFVPSGSTSDVTEYLFGGKAYYADGTEVTFTAPATAASTFRSIDPVTGNVLQANGQPVDDPGNPGNPLNINQLQRKLTARNISVSDAWKNDPMHITRETKNSALAVDGSGELLLADGTSSGIILGNGVGEVYSIGAGGELLDINGDTIPVAGSALTLDRLQKVMTESADAPATFADYLDGSGDLVWKSDSSTLAPGDFVDSGGAPCTSFIGWEIDDEGYLIDGPGGDRVSLTSDPDKRININDFAQQKFPKLSPGAPTPNGLLPGEKANGNLDQMKIALLAKDRTFSNGFKGSFQEYLIGFQQDMANDKETNDSLLSGTINVLTGLADSRDGISAVSIDEEGISMMTYQNYYNAAARYMTTLDEALDKIINGMGTVGR